MKATKSAKRVKIATSMSMTRTVVFQSSCDGLAIVRMFDGKLEWDDDDREFEVDDAAATMAGYTI